MLTIEMLKTKYKENGTLFNYIPDHITTLDRLKEFCQNATGHKTKDDYINFLTKNGCHFNSYIPTYTWHRIANEIEAGRLIQF